MKRRFKNRAKNPARKTRPAKQQEKNPSWPPDGIHWAGPGSLTDVMLYLGGRYIKDCCDSPSKCDHRFSMHNGWEILCGLLRMPEEKFAELPKGVQTLVGEFKRADAALDKMEARVLKYLPQKGQQRALSLYLHDAFTEYWTAALDFCSAWAYATGSFHGRELLRRKIFELSHEVDSLSFDHDDRHFKRTFLAPICRDIGGAKKEETAPTP